jgi:hypothetical protein
VRCRTLAMGDELRAAASSHDGMAAACAAALGTRSAAAAAPSAAMTSGLDTVADAYLLRPPFTARRFVPSRSHALPGREPGTPGWPCRAGHRRTPRRAPRCRHSRQVPPHEAWRAERMARPMTLAAWSLRIHSRSFMSACPDIEGSAPSPYVALTRIDSRWREPRRGGFSGGLRLLCKPGLVKSPVSPVHFRSGLRRSAKAVGNAARCPPSPTALLLAMEKLLAVST